MGIYRSKWVEWNPTLLFHVVVKLGNSIPDIQIAQGGSTRSLNNIPWWYKVQWSILLWLPASKPVFSTPLHSCVVDTQTQVTTLLQHLFQQSHRKRKKWALSTAQPLSWIKLQHVSLRMLTFPRKTTRTTGSPRSLSPDLTVESTWEN